jgi:predicted AlkP superfamily phosphohydrolase/phosphomutase
MTTQANTKGQKLLWITLDCTEWSLIDKWIESGELPNLAKLKGQSGFARLNSTADVLVATPSPTTMTSQYPIQTGMVCWMQWRAELMKQERWSPDWMPLNPFYRRLGPLGKRVIAIDVPMAYDPVPFDGIEVASWGSYDKLCDLASYPEGYVKKLQQKYHKLPIGPEYGQLEPIKNQIKLRDELVKGTEAVGDACRDIIQEEEWDLFIVGLGAGHRAGHNLWDHSSFKEKEGEAPAHLVKEYDDALKEVYKALDRQVGKLLDVVDDDVAVMALATHGMGPTTSRFDLFDQLFYPVLENRKAIPVEPGSQKGGLVSKLRNAIPVRWRSEVKRRLPAKVQDMLTMFWAGGNKDQDWSQVKAFTVAGDLEGYVYINLKGREAKGAVEPEDYEPLMQRLSEGLLSWKDKKTGERIIEKVVRGNDMWPQVPKDVRKPMPDLIIQWSQLPAVQSQEMVSDEFGQVNWPLQDKCPDGRSGHHVPTGWLMLRADGVEPGKTFDAHSIIDLAPTAMSLMGLEPFDDFFGEPIETANHDTPMSKSA